jgi:hypothetical protein
MLTFQQFMESVNLSGKPRKVGKRMADIYVHRDHTEAAGLPQDALKRAKAHLPKDHEYHIVKHNPKEGSFSFIHSPDFDTAHEPIAGKAIKVHADGKLTTTKQKADPQIYHHKWEMVPDDYKGFDVAASKARSKHWRGIVGTDRAVSSRIGTKSYWDREVVPKLHK